MVAACNLKNHIIKEHLCKLQILRSRQTTEEPAQLDRALGSWNYGQRLIEATKKELLLMDGEGIKTMEKEK